MRRTALPVAVAAVLLAPAAANASGFATARFGAEQGTPVSANPTALYYNPAAIAETEGLRIFVDGSFAFRSATYTHDTAPTDVPEPVGGEGANNGQASLFNFAAAPMIGATYKTKSNLAFGAGFYVPFGGASAWNKNEKFEGNTQFAGPVDGVSRWHSIDGSLRSMFATAGVAYRIEAARLSIGVTGNLIISNTDTLRARNTTGSNRLDTEGRALINASGLSGSFGVGAMFEAMPRQLWIGASYQSMPGVVGGLALDGKLKLKSGPGAASEQDITLYQDLPQIIRLGVKARPKDWLELRLFGDVSMWSVVKDQCLAAKGEECKVNEDGSAADGTAPIQNVPRRWQDAFGVRAGVSLFPRDTIEVMAGAGYDSSAIPDETLDPSITDFDDISVALGGRMQFVKQFAAAVTYTHLFYLPRNTAGKATAFAAPSNGPDSGGTYTQSIGVINANVELSF